MSALFDAKRGLAKAVGSLSRRSGRGGGTTLPGRLLVRMAPDAIERLAARLERGSIVVSSTNGKTTTAGMIASILQAAGRRPVHNRAGSNMHWGVATALLEQSGDEGLFELDEAWLPRVAPRLRPRLLVLGNLFRDQLDRYGELERLADEWAELVAALEGSCEFALNADDPLIADLGRDRDCVGAPASPTSGSRTRARRCPSSNTPTTPSTAAAAARRTPTSGRSSGISATTSAPTATPIGRCRTSPRPRSSCTGSPGRGYGSERPMASSSWSSPSPVSTTSTTPWPPSPPAFVGRVPRRVREGLESMRAVFGRVETIEVSGKPVSILLIKNPAGANQVLRTLALESSDGGIDLWLALNDRIADGRDVSWIWDADFELLAGGVRHVTCAGTRATEMALRLKYAGWPLDSIEVMESIEGSLDAAVAAAPERLFALPTYTALLELRTLLTDRGLAADYWQ